MRWNDIPKHLRIKLSRQDRAAVAILAEATKKTAEQVLAAAVDATLGAVRARAFEQVRKERPEVRPDHLDD